MDANQLITDLTTGKLAYENVYNIDQPSEILLTSEYYKNNPNDVEIDQKLSISFTDIEIFQGANLKNHKMVKMNFTTSDCFPVNAITIYSTKFKIYHACILLVDFNIDLFTSDDFEIAIKELREEHGEDDGKFSYVVEGESIQLHVFTDEVELIRFYWNKLNDDNDVVLSGYNADQFDYPYMYRRTMKLCDSFGGEDATNQMMCRFDTITVNNHGLLNVPGYSILDQLYLYRTRDSGGLNYGKKLVSYSLEAVSKIVLKGLTKLKYNDKYPTLDHFYAENPIGFLLYNIVDVALCVRMNEVLGFVDLHNTIRRNTRTSFNYSLRGSSALFESFTFEDFYRHNKAIRSRLQTELNAEFEENPNIIFPEKQIKTVQQLKPIEITRDMFLKVRCRFSGAYVKQTVPKIHTKLALDVDATALYPSVMMQHNIDWRTFYAKILDPSCYKLLELFEKFLGKSEHGTMFPFDKISLRIHESTMRYINDNEITPKKENYNIYYNIIMNCMYTLVASNLTLEQIFVPQNKTSALLLKRILLPLLDIIVNVNRKDVHNVIVYDYLFMDEAKYLEKYKGVELYVLNDIVSPKQMITKMPAVNMSIIPRDYILTITGCVFYKHEDKLGFCPGQLGVMLSNRRKFVAMANETKYNSEEYHRYNRYEKSFKKNANSWYGVNGLSTYRYSNHNLAHTITTCGRLALKVSQAIIEKNLPKLAQSEDLINHGN